MARAKLPTEIARRGVAVALSLAWLFATSSARAGGDNNVAIAEQLFADGNALMADRRYEEACAKFKAARDLDGKATGSLLNLAICHEITKKPASAWAEFRQVAAESEKERPDRVKVAREHERKLLPILSYLTVTVPPDARAPGLVVELDARPLVLEAWGSEVPIDPGGHVLRASAPGKVPATQDFVILAEADRRHVVVAPLADVPREDEPRSTSQRTLGFVAGGAGLASIGVGLVFGLAASNRYSSATSVCPKNDVCDTKDQKIDADHNLSVAKTDAIVSDITVGVGAALLVGGVVLVLTSSGSSAPKASALRVVPTASPSGGGMIVGSTW
jgi:hypothetical protein